jgi:cytoskeletal protein CcmA (bactofilin family)
MWGKNERDVRPGMTPQPSYTPPPEKPQPTAAPSQSVQHSPAPSSSGPATLGKSTRLRGEIYSEEELYLDGDMEGTIEVRNRLTIGPNGKVKAAIRARDVVVRGSVQGNVEATDRIAIMNGATIVGDVKTAGIVIEDGAYFKGGIDILRPEPKKQDSAGKQEPSGNPVPKAQTAGTR